MTRAAALLAQLEAYAPAGERESAHHRAIVNLLTTSADPFSRAGFEPGHITASCFIVDPSTARILLHHHRRLDRWLQMGGHVDGEESPLEAALREGREESGLADLALMVDGVADLDVHVIPPGKGEPEHRHFDIRYAAFTRHPQSIAIDRNESRDLAWIALDEAGPLMNEEASWRALAKIRSLL